MLTDPIELLQDDLQAETIAERVRALHRLRYVATATPPDQIKEKLIPLLCDLINDNDDEIAYTLAEELLCLVDYIGVDEVAFDLLFPPFKSLIVFEETIVREKALESIIALLEKARSNGVSQSLINFHLLSATLDLSKSEAFAARISACTLICCIYKEVQGDSRSQLRQCLIDLCQDEIPFIQNAAIKKLAEIIHCDENDLALFETVYVPLTLKLWDTHLSEQTRACAILPAAEIADRFQTTFKAQLGPLLISACENKQWKIRLTLAQTLPKFIAGLDLFDALSPTLIEFLLDADPRIVTETLQACQHYPGLFRNRKDFLATALHALATHPNVSVREVLFNTILKLSSSLKNEGPAPFLEIVKDLIRDESQTIRVNIVGNAGQLCELWGVQNILDPLVESIEILIGDPHWRVRLSALTQLPNIAKQCGPEYMKTTLQSLYLNAFNDPVHAIRQCAIENLEHLSRIFGVNWVPQEFLHDFFGRYSFDIASECAPPPCAAKSSDVGNGLESCGPDHPELCGKPLNSSFRMRMTILRMIPSIIKASPPEIVGDFVIPLLRKGFQDPINNVRLATVRVLEEVHVIDPLLIPEDLKTHLTVLSQDASDADIQYHSAQLLTRMEAASSSSPSALSTKEAEPQKFR